MRNLILLYVLAFAALSLTAADRPPKIFDSVEIYAISPDLESPSQIDRDLLPTHFSKKITLGLPPTYRFSRLLNRWQTQADYGTDAGVIEAPHILFVAQKTHGALHLAVDLKSSRVEIDGRILKSGATKRELLEYIRELVGSL